VLNKRSFPPAPSKQGVFGWAEVSIRLCVRRPTLFQPVQVGVGVFAPFLSQRESTSIRFPLQGEALLLQTGGFVTGGRVSFRAKSNDIFVIWKHLPDSFCSNPRQPKALRRRGIRRRSLRT
jgi:hypothetical protein